MRAHIGFTREHDCLPPDQTAARFRPIGGFSTGMRQRTKLAQAIVADPEVVLLDEATAGLDPIGREEMLSLVGSPQVIEAGPASVGQVQA